MKIIDEMSEHSPEEWEKIKGAIRRSFEPSLRKRLQSFFPWLYAPRRIDGRPRDIRVSGVNPVSVGHIERDPISGEFTKIIHIYDAINRAGRFYEYRCEVETWRELPSRWESLKARIAWYAEYIFLAYWARSDKSVLESMRKRGHKA